MKCHVSRLYGCLVLVCCLWTCFRLYQDPFASCPTNNERDICFVTCIFGNSIEEVDHPANVQWFETRWCHTEFWLVTNLADLPAPGWTKILFDTDPRLSHIVQSRHAKFLGWKVLQPQVQSCKAVIYMDGYLQPKASLSRFQKIAKDVQTSHWGLAQVEQPYYRGSTMESILNQLVVDRKDTKEHVQGTLEWFQQQDDYQDVMTYYLNKYFAYNPRNRNYQELSTFFWEHYTTYGGLWRDQPLWSYVIHHFNATPLAMTTKGTITRGGDLFKRGGKLGWDQHIYVNEDGG